MTDRALGSFDSMPVRCLNQLEALGVFTVGDLMAQDREFMETELGELVEKSMKTFLSGLGLTPPWALR